MVSLIERRGYSRNDVFVLPEGWADAQELAMLVGKHELTVSSWLESRQVPRRRFPRVNAQGVRLGGRGVDGWLRQEAVPVLQRILREMKAEGRVNCRLKGVEQ